MPYQPKPFDETLNVCAAQAKQLADSGFTLIFLEWTCTVCGERSQIQLPIDPITKIVGFYEWLIHEEKEDGSACGRKLYAPSYKFTVIGVGDMDKLEKVM
ncbi:MAG: hypothetical protein EHM23_00895 [Acidobacteria bacterium]|nr:MAG: hypothetical protein EHM23_00895 [Acidobacteriota bacterium]